MNKLSPKKRIWRGVVKASILAFPAIAPIIVLSCPYGASADGTVSAGSQLDTLFRLSARRFWSVETASDVYQIPDQTIRPLKAGDPKMAAYRRVADTAEAFLRVQARIGTADWRTPVEKYLDIMCLASLGEHVKVVAAIDSFLADYPDYVRHRSDTTTAYDHSVRGPLMQLRLYSLVRLLVPDSPDASTSPSPPEDQTQENSALRPISLPAPRRATPSQPLALRAVLGHRSVLDFLKDATDQAATATTEQNATYARKDMDAFMADCTQQPDELRAKALPDTLVTLIALHEKLLPEALGTAGSKAVRDYLRAMATIQTADSNGHQKPFFGYANHKLQSIDHDILAQYQGEAEKAIAQKRWTDARKWLMLIMTEYPVSDAARNAKARMDFVTISECMDDAAKALALYHFDEAHAEYRKIIAEFPDTSDAVQAQDDIKKTVPVAVKYYRQLGDSTFHPENQYEVGQTQAVEYYHRMYNEDPTGPEADYALVRWSRALGTVGEIDTATGNLTGFEQKFPKSMYASQALFLIGFYSGLQQGPQRFEAIKIFRALLERYPQSSEAPESLWLIAFMEKGTGQSAVAIADLRQLQKAYPDSKRAQYVPSLISSIQMSSG